MQQYEKPHIYQRMTQAIEYLASNPQSTSLGEIAATIHMSVFHFQRLFVSYVGVTPKEFVQALSIEHAKLLLQNSESIMDAAFNMGLSGASRLHDLFLTVEAMTPGEYKKGGAHLEIKWTTVDTILGLLLIASTKRGICHMAFIAEEKDESMQYAIAQLVQQWPQATLCQAQHELQEVAYEVKQRIAGVSPQKKLGVVLTGTPFRLKVWQALLRIPEGSMVSYQQLAKMTGTSRAVRAVASAVANNALAYLIPCHRVIRANAEFGQYRWGANRKKALLGVELARHRVGVIKSDLIQK